jgi:hypothetical protein
LKEHQFVQDLQPKFPKFSTQEIRLLLAKEKTCQEILINPQLNASQKIELIEKEKEKAVLEDVKRLIVFDLKRGECIKYKKIKCATIQDLDQLITSLQTDLKLSNQSIYKCLKACSQAGQAIIVSRLQKYYSEQYPFNIPNGIDNVVYEINQNHVTISNRFKMWIVEDGRQKILLIVNATLKINYETGQYSMEVQELGEQKKVTKTFTLQGQYIDNSYERDMGNSDAKDQHIIDDKNILLEE